MAGIICSGIHAFLLSPLQCFQKSIKPAPAEEKSCNGFCDFFQFPLQFLKNIRKLVRAVAESHPQICFIREWDASHMMHPTLFSFCMLKIPVLFLSIDFLTLSAGFSFDKAPLLHNPARYNNASILPGFLLRNRFLSRKCQIGYSHKQYSFALKQLRLLSHLHMAKSLSTLLQASYKARLHPEKSYSPHAKSSLLFF